MAEFKFISVNVEKKFFQLLTVININKFVTKTIENLYKTGKNCTDHAQ